MHNFDSYRSRMRNDLSPSTYIYAKIGVFVSRGPRAAAVYAIYMLGQGRGPSLAEGEIVCEVMKGGLPFSPVN